MIEDAGGNSITTVVLEVDMNEGFDMYSIISLISNKLYTILVYNFQKKYF